MRNRWRKIKESVEWRALQLTDALSLKFMSLLSVAYGWLSRLDGTPAVLALERFLHRLFTAACTVSERSVARRRVLLESRHQRWLDQQPKESAVMKYAMLLRGVRKD